MGYVEIISSDIDTAILARPARPLLRTLGATSAGKDS
jgi:hypothetical protein